METLALRLYGENDLRLERFDLPSIADDEILAEVVSNSICMSDYKATIQGAKHKRVPADCATNPIIMGHEFAGKVLEVGKKWQGIFKPGDLFAMQPALGIPGKEHLSIGYSFPTCGGHAVRVVVPSVVMERNCLLPYSGDTFFTASLAEPVSCIIAAFKSSYHYKIYTYDYIHGIKPGGAFAVLAGAGPMGLEAVDIALHFGAKPKVIVVTDISQERLDRAAKVIPVAKAAEEGVALHYVNTANLEDPVATLKALSPDGKGFDDVFVFAPVDAVVQQASAILGFNGCLNFFAGPTDKKFSATMNFYDVHYSGHHVVGSSGGNTQDLQDALDAIADGRLNPAVMVTHVGGIDSAGPSTLILPKIPGGKKLVYTHISMPMTAIDDFAELGKTDPLFAKLAEICDRHNGLWSLEAEHYLLANGKPAM